MSKITEQDEKNMLGYLMTIILILGLVIWILARSLDDAWEARDELIIEMYDNNMTIKDEYKYVVNNELVRRYEKKLKEQK